MRLIDADKAIMAIEQHRIAVLEGHKWDEGIEYGYAAAHRHIVDIVEQLPSAQPDIIRCKDCKYYKYGICMKIGANKSFYGFCDWAERGEQNG